MGTANLGGLSFRINPSQVSWDYNVDVSVIPTVGGRVVQVYGVTMGDMTIQGLFGVERTGQKRESWQLAEQFQKDLGLLVNKQSAIPTAAQLSGADSTPMHPPMRFVYTDDSHNWDFTVYIKALKDVDNPSATVEHKTGKYSYGYTLTLFIVQDNTGKLAQVAKNEFIDRLSNGLGWKRSAYNGFMSTDELQNYLAANTSDGTIHGLVLQEFQQAGQGQTFQIAPPSAVTGVQQREATPLPLPTTSSPADAGLPFIPGG
jgi:hypothetical protein